MSDTSGNAQPPPPKVHTAQGFFRAIKENFVLVSGSVAVIGVALATLFLFSYLSVFDWHLMWFVEYTDILTFGLVAVAIVGSSLLLVLSGANVMLDTFGFEYRRRVRWWVLIAILGAAIVGWNVYGSIKQGEGYWHILFGAADVGLGYA